ncbi:MAG: hypothetical protein EGP11_07650 [SAR202 cluster bacterium]|nr:MAG: hypothetical protein EGP11_07650 [SAR202 cluster bacterium]
MTDEGARVLMDCISCSLRNLEYAHYCARCGTNLQQSLRTAMEGQISFCFSCGLRIFDDARFCGQCGVDLAHGLP